MVTTYECPSCRAENEETRKYCGECGDELYDLAQDEADYCVDLAYDAWRDNQL
jgi:hypothetical protein